jgi:hypothetical protein
MSRRRSTRTTPTRAASTQIGSTCRRARARIRPRARPAPAGSHRSQLVAAVVSGALAGAAVHVARLCRLCARLPAPPGAGRTARRLSPAATPPPHVFYGAYDGCGRVVVSSCCAGGWWNGQVRPPGQQCCRAGGARPRRSATLRDSGRTIPPQALRRPAPRARRARARPIGWAGGIWPRPGRPRSGVGADPRRHPLGSRCAPALATSPAPGTPPQAVAGGGSTGPVG